MKRISISLLVASSLALAACGSETDPSEEETTDQTSDITGVDVEAAQAQEHSGPGSTSLTQGAELGGACVSCGPLPDPWGKKDGPLPDPWKSTGGGGGGGGAGTSSTGTGSGTGQH